MHATTAKEAAVVDGLHAEVGVEYLARLEGFEGAKVPPVVILSRGFSEKTGFFKDSKGRGYWMTTLNECSCPDWRYRKAGTGTLCKHQKKLAAALHKRGEPVPGIVLQVCGIVPGGWDPLGRGRLPQGVRAMTSEEMEARRARIAERNRQRQEEMEARRAKAPAPSTATGGFSLPEEART